MDAGQWAVVDLLLGAVVLLLLWWAFRSAAKRRRERREGLRKYLNRWVDAQRAEGRTWTEIALAIRPERLGRDAVVGRQLYERVRRTEVEEELNAVDRPAVRTVHCSSCGAVFSATQEVPADWRCHGCRKAAERR